MGKIDPTARIEDGAVIGDGATIGPYCVIGGNAVIGKGCTLSAHVTVHGHTTIGDNCTISPFAALGGPPQDLSYRGEPTRLEIGRGCTIREGVTMNVGTVKGGGLTRVGERGYFMNNSHVGHDCVVGSDVIFATSATLGGHCEIGPQVMVGGVCGVRGDIIPFGLVNGQYAALEGLNIIGMKRRKFTKQRLAIVRNFYQKLFHGPGIFAERLEAVQPMAAEDPAIAEILNFIAEAKHRALCLPADNGSRQH
jgi:UDP-N-acetylglucosamine acyltransferase